MEFLKAHIERPVSFISCGHFISEGQWIHKKRIIDSFEIIIGTKGTAYIQQEDQKYEVTPGKVLLLFPGILHQGYEQSQGETSFYWVHFHLKDQYEILKDKEAISLISPLKSNAHTSQLNGSILIPDFSNLQDREKVTVLFRQLLHMSRSKYYTALGTNYLLTLILVEISQQVISGMVSTFSNDTVCINKKLNEIVEWIRINKNNDISVKGIADKFNFNRDYFSRLFKKHLGVGVIDYINSMKVSNAKELLCQSDKTIKEVAYLVGFKDEKYFMKLFKRYEGITPSQFRNAYYQTHLNNS